MRFFVFALDLPIVDVLLLNSEFNMNRTLRILTAVAIIPTFVFLALSICCCPNAKAAPAHQAVLKNAHSCCCPENNDCPKQLGTIRKEQATIAEAFYLHHDVFPSSALIVHNGSEKTPKVFSDFASRLNPSLFSQTERLFTVQLLI